MKQIATYSCDIGYDFIYHNWNKSASHPPRENRENPFLSRSRAITANLA